MAEFGQGPDRVAECEITDLEGLQRLIESLVIHQIGAEDVNGHIRHKNIAPYHQAFSRINEAIWGLFNSKLFPQKEHMVGLEREAWESITKQTVLIRDCHGLHSPFPADIVSAWTMLRGIYDALEQLLVTVKLAQLLKNPFFPAGPTMVTRGKVKEILGVRTSF